MSRLSGDSFGTQGRALLGSQGSRRRLMTLTAGGLQLLGKGSFVAMPTTSWVPADVGSSPVVSGLTFDVVAIGVGGTVTVGGGSQGLRLSGATTANIRWRLPKDLRGGSGLPASGTADQWSTVMAQFAVYDLGQNAKMFLGVTLGGTPPESNGWSTETTGNTTLTSYRADNLFTGSGGGARAAAAATGAYMLVGTAGSTHTYKYAGAVDPADIPHPNDPGWEYVVGAQVSTYGHPWPFLAANDGRQGLVWNGTNTFRIEGYALWGV